MGKKLMGYEKLIFTGVKGSTAATQILNATDIDDKFDHEKGETTVGGARTSPPIVTERVAALKHEISFKIRYDEADTVLADLIAAAVAGEPVAIRTKSSSTGKGYDGDCNLKYDHPGPLKSGQELSFTATPNNDEREPQLYV